MSHQNKKGKREHKLRHISGREAMRLLTKEGVLVDVRPEYELGRLFDVDRIFYCPYKEVEENLAELPTDVPLIIADAVGIRSNEVCRFLLERGFTNIFNLAGGIVDWERMGYSVSKDHSKILTGSCMCQLKVRNKKN